MIDEVDKKTGEFRQHKTFVGFGSASAAREAYVGTDGKSQEMREKAASAQKVFLCKGAQPLRPTILSRKLLLR